jgi:methionyl-tRNA formyltransferase
MEINSWLPKKLIAGLWHNLLTIMVKTIDMEQDRNNPTPQDDKHELYVDEITREKVRKHWSDPNDKITEKDIENVNTDIYARPTTDEEKEALNDIAEDITPKKAPNPWDVRSE